MTTLLVKDVLPRFRDLGEHLRRRIGTGNRESVYFFTFHKCASSLFGGYVLKNVEGLRSVDLETRIYQGERLGRLRFEETGHIYGPLRLSTEAASPIHTQLTESVGREEFVQDKSAVFLVRDPRDILVSAYYSFGQSHGYSAVPEIQEMQKQRRSRIQTLSIDEYAVRNVDTVAGHFRTAAQLSRVCRTGTVLKYEDMIDDFDSFLERLTAVLTLKRGVAEEMYQRSRPKQREDTSSHRRSGRPGGFRCKLTDETIHYLNDALEDVLEEFRYAP